MSKEWGLKDLMIEAYKQDGVMGLLSIALFSAFSVKQRNWIANVRDEGRCQATVPHKCNQEKGLEVDHILPQAYLYSLGVDPDYPENALSKCKNAHDIKHPDRVLARKQYHRAKQEGRDTFKEMHQAHVEGARNRIITWNSENDRQDHVRAVQRTQRAKNRGEVMPDPPVKRKSKEYA